MNLGLSNVNQVGLSSVGGYSYGQLDQTFAGGLRLDEYSENREEFNNDTHVVPHELGHIYTLTAGITKNKAAPAVGLLYLDILLRDNSVICSAYELYADLAVVAFQNSYSEFDLRNKNLYYWNGCNIQLDPQTHEKVVSELREITRSVFIDQEIPRWFYDNYQFSDGSIDLDKFWQDISVNAMSLIIYGFKDEFGGYCSDEEVRQFHRGELASIKTPWVDSGNCQRAEPELPEPVEEPEIGAEDDDPVTECAGETPIVVASDAAAESDRYSAATLAGVLGTDCIISAGDRDQPMAADQQARLDTAAPGGYIVGGTAAVTDAKIASYSLKRLAGTDRWHTARLVGDQARRIAANQPANPL